MARTSATETSIRRRRAGLGRIDAKTSRHERRKRAHRRVAARRPHRKRRTAVRAVLILVSLLSSAITAVIGTALFGYGHYLGELPDAATVGAMEPPLDSYVYARDGTLIRVFHISGARHTHVGLNDVSLYARLATIDIEDRHFYSEQSFDLPRLAKAGINNITHHGSTQGASTISEQLAKISFLNDTGSLDYKIKEIVLGNEISNNFTKDQVLEMYLNRVFYGNQSVGIETAAEIYFQTTAKKLDLAQSAMLAGFPQSPSAYDPVANGGGNDSKKRTSLNCLDLANQKVSRTKVRQCDVLAAMLSNGDITQKQALDAYNEPLTFHGWWESEPNLAPDFTAYLNNWLVSKYGDAFVDPGGWNIYTTLDLGKQAQSDQAVHDGISKVSHRFNATDGAMVSLDPKTGEILAMTGSFDYSDPQVGQLNMATQLMQPGSTIKLFTYSAAIASRKYTMITPILDAPIKLDDGSSGGYTPHNYDRRYHGICPLKICLGNSFNIPAVKTEAAVGIPYITNLEIAMGLTSLAQPGNTPCDRCYAATLGSLTYGISPLELADGAATIADMGIHHPPTPVIKIVNRLVPGNQVIYQHDPVKEGNRALPENAAFIMAEITSNDSNRVAEFGRGSDLTLPDRRVSAKTGTTDFFQSNWTVGWTPDIVTAVWVGNPTPSCLKPSDRQWLSGHLRYGDGLNDPLSPGDLSHYGLQPVNNHCGHLEGSTGITGAAPIWHQYMHAVTQGTPATWYTKPSDVIEYGSGDNGDFFIPGATGWGTCIGSCYSTPSPTPAPTP